MEIDVDFVEWCSQVINKLIEASKNSSSETRLLGVNEKLLAETIFGTEMVSQPNFAETSQYRSLLNAISQLESVSLIERYKTLRWWRVTNDGRKFAKDTLPFWQSICQEPLEADEEELLRVINQLSPVQAEDHVSLSYVTHETILSILQWPGGIDQLLFVAQNLKRLNFITTRETVGKRISIWATYRGLVWETRRNFTIESKFIDDLVKDWETTSVEFKQYLYVKTVEQKAEFIKDVLSLANTQASGRRWMIIGFHNKTHAYFGPPNPELKQDDLERLIAEYTDPYVDVRYEIVGYQKGFVGKLEVLRDPRKVPYRVAKPLGDKLKGDKKQILEGQIFVRHGSQVEEPTDAERQALQEEGDRARLKL